MKKIIIITILLITVILAVACTPQTTTQEQTETVNTQSSDNQGSFQNTPSPSEVLCPHGRVHEDYPGCGLYRDSDGSGYFDLSE